MRRELAISFLVLFLTILACTSTVEQEAQQAVADAADAVIEETQNTLMDAAQQNFNRFTDYVSERIKPFIPRGFINSIQWLVDENVVVPSRIDPALALASSLSDYLELTTGIGGSRAIPVVNAVWSSFNFVNSGSRCLEQADTLWELSSKECFDASLSLSSGALALAALLAAGTASAPVIIAFSGAAAALQFVGNFIKWE